MIDQSLISRGQIIYPPLHELAQLVKSTIQRFYTIDITIICEETNRETVVDHDRRSIVSVAILFCHNQLSYVLGTS